MGQAIARAFAADGAKVVVAGREQQLKTLADQIKGPFQMLQDLIETMESGSSITNISSAAAIIGFENRMAYTGAKAGMEHVLREVANEYGCRGIRLNTIAPVLTETPLSADYHRTPGVVDAFVEEYPLGR